MENLHTQPLVSIIMSTYNAERFIKDTIENILQQSYPNIEIFIIDDCSTDTTRSILEKRYHDNPIIQIFHNTENLWPYPSLNILLDQAQWTYIAVQDHDDLWHPEKIEKQIEFLEKNHYYIWCGTKTLMWYESDQKGFTYFLWKSNCYTIHPSLMFRNSRNYRYPTDSVYMNDALFQKIVLCRGWKKIIANIDETLTLHVIKDGAKNLSYKRFRYTRSTFKTIFTLHPVWYGICIIWWETMRKIVYPLLQCIWQGKWIDVIERLPFILLGNGVKKYSREEVHHYYSP